MRKPRFDINGLIINLIGYSQINAVESPLLCSTIFYAVMFLPVTKDELLAGINELITEQILEKTLDANGQTAYSLKAKGKEKFERHKQIGFAAMPPQIALILAASKEALLLEHLRFLEGFYDNWTGNFVHVLADELAHGDKLHDNLYICYLVNQSSVIDWLTESLYTANYEIVLRELRSILEGLYLTYTIDLKDINLSFDEKLDQWDNLEKNRENYGVKIFKKSLTTDWKEYYELYKELSGYVHASRKIIGNEMIGSHGIDAIDPEFNKYLFINCVTTLKKITVLASNLATNLLSEFSIQFTMSPEVFDYIDYSHSDSDIDF